MALVTVTATFANKNIVKMSVWVIWRKKEKNKNAKSKVLRAVEGTKQAGSNTISAAFDAPNHPGKDEWIVVKIAGLVEPNLGKVKSVITRKLF
jgi:hypothetical protein